MTKIEITDAMVQRAVTTFEKLWPSTKSFMNTMRQTLDAALNPPPEPYIEVTKEMCVAGAYAYNGFLLMNQPIKQDGLASIGGVSAAYRAMRALEPKPVAAHDNGTIFTTRGASRLHNRKNDTGRNSYFHRRTGDPK